MMNWLTKNLLWTEGRMLVVVLAVAGLLIGYFFPPALYGIAVLFIFCFFFFRNPERVCVEAQHDATVLVCPADGWVVGIDTTATHDLDGYAQRVSIFLTPFDVHVNWLPYAGTVENVVYHKGTFAFAFLPKSSDKNERNDVVITTVHHKKIKVRQIAGSIARTIVCWVQVGQGLLAGQKFGMIKFGSRVDVFLPENVQVAVTNGQRVKGGQTVLGYWR
jgi:phosphatidylserine decarboxylase